MARIAIVIGVSHYTRQQELPACNNDAELVQFVLECSKAYEEILVIAGANTQSDNVKHQLTQFVEKHKARNDLDEVFFFYSGHGQFIDDEFYYIFSDFDESRRNRTCLKNSELDGYLRTLGPTLAVKIVDACNAGVQYVKDIGGLTEVIENGSKAVGLNKVYFLFSSLFDQSSFANSIISDYTRSFIDSICTNIRPEIRYRDIIDQISDQFQSNGSQKPFFVIQADNTEIFGSFPDKEKNEIRTRLESLSAPAPSVTLGIISPTKQATLADLIKEKAKDYLSDLEIIQSIETLPLLAKQYTLPLDIKDLFEIEVKTAKDFQGLSSLGGVGKWLDDNKKDYFARVQIRVEEYEGYDDSWQNLALLMSNNASRKKIKKTRNVITGYEPMWDKLTFWRIDLSLKTGLPNIPTYKLNILYLFSRLDIRIFYSIDEKWLGIGGSDNRMVHGEWKGLQLRLRELKDDSKVVMPLFEDFTTSILDNLKKIAGIANEPSIDLADVDRGEFDK